MAGFLNDLRIALRTLGQRPGFALVIVLTLALGIGANTAIFGVVNACMLRPLPFPDADRLVALEDHQPPDDLTPASFPEFEDWRKGNQAFDFVAARFIRNLNLVGRHEPARVRAALVSQDYFPMLRAQPVLGRTFSAAEHQPGAPAVAVISAGLWQREFGGDPHAIGQSITLDRTPYTVVGVVAEQQLRFGSPRVTDIWAPLERDLPWRERGTHFLTVVAKLKPGVTLERARHSLKVLAKGWRNNKYSLEIAVVTLRAPAKIHSFGWCKWCSRILMRNGNQPALPANRCWLCYSVDCMRIAVATITL